MTGNTGAAATIYAPDADYTLSRHYRLFGSVRGKTVNIAGNANIHYDRRLADATSTSPAVPWSRSFTWKRY